MMIDAKRRRRRNYMFGSLLLSCLGASLLVTSFATENWFQSDSQAKDSDLATGKVNFGLFKGQNIIEKDVMAYRKYIINVVCMDGKCMYSCASSKEYRQDQLQMLFDGVTNSVNLKEHCERVDKTARQLPMMIDWVHTQLNRDIADIGRTDLVRLFHPPVNSVSAVAVPDEREGEIVTTTTPESVKTTTSDITEPFPVDELEFMDYGLWVGTITCLSAGLLMALVGALFAIVNTATTPVEAITGVPGLYLWNVLAALFDLLTVILWAVQFHVHLSSNVLLYDASDGWTTEGMEVFGYSFWLVLVAIFVHVGNIAVIYTGAWEPKIKAMVQAPDQKGGNIMLY